MKNNIINNYTKYYIKKKITNLYPSEFVVRSFLGNYPNYRMNKNFRNKKILDLSFGDGKNLKFLYDLGFNVFGTEISRKIISKCQKYLNKNKTKVDLKIGMNSDIPFENNFFNFILAAHSCYYLNENDNFDSNLNEISRVLKKNGYFIGSVPTFNNYYFKNADKVDKNKFKIKYDYLKIRQNSFIAGFKNEKDLSKYLKKYFKNINFGYTDNNFYGINENMIIFSCVKK